MAITINIAPENLSRVYDTNTNYFEIYSSNFSQNNFRLSLKLYELGLYSSTSTLVSEVKLIPDLNGKVYFNPSTILKNLITTDEPDLVSDDLNPCLNSITRYYIHMTEQYGDPVADDTTGDTSICYVYNGCQIYENYTYLYGSSYWIVKSGVTTGGNFLSPVENLYLGLDDYSYLYFIYSGATDSGLILNFYFYNNSTQVDLQQIDPFLLTGTTMYSIGIGPANLPTGISLPSSAWTHYVINMGNDEGTIYSQSFTVYKKDVCNKYDYTQVFWLNEHGGWSNFTFNKKRISETKINRSNFEKFLNYGYSTTSTLNPYRGTTQFNIEIEETITLNSDWLNNDEALLIKSLMFSPDVRIKYSVSSGKFYRSISKLIPYVVVDADFIEKNVTNDKMFSYSIKMKKATQKIIQGG